MKRKTCENCKYRKMRFNREECAKGQRQLERSGHCEAWAANAKRSVMEFLEALLQICPLLILGLAIIVTIVLACWLDQVVLDSDLPGWLKVMILRN